LELPLLLPCPEVMPDRKPAARELLQFLVASLFAQCLSHTGLTSARRTRRLCSRCFAAVSVGRNILRGPNFKNADLSISRVFPLKLRESARLMFRSEFFNAFNRVNLGLPNGTIGNSNFGRITSTDGGPRILQFSVKVEF
jgi:hypothetical protein